MSTQHFSGGLLRFLLGVGLVVSVALYDAGSGLPGFLLYSAGIDFSVQAANKDHTSTRLLKEMVPGADSFSEKGGEVPVYRAYKTDPESGEKTLIGYAVVTADVLPEPNGYNGPIDTLIGIDLEGNIVGIKAIYYKESLRYSLGDFLSFRKFRDQFIGKTAADQFRVDGDIDGVAKATISSKAMARGVRQALRAVTEAYIK